MRLQDDSFWSSFLVFTPLCTEHTEVFKKHLLFKNLSQCMANRGWHKCDKMLKLLLVSFVNTVWTKTGQKHVYGSQSEWHLCQCMTGECSLNSLHAWTWKLTAQLWSTSWHTLYWRSNTSTLYSYSIITTTLRSHSWANSKFSYIKLDSFFSKNAQLMFHFLVQQQFQKYNTILITVIDVKTDVFEESVRLLVTRRTGYGRPRVTPLHWIWKDNNKQLSKQ